MAERKTGLAALPAGLLRPTTLPEPATPAEDPATAEGVEDQGRGDAAAEPRPASAKSRRKRPAPTGETKARNLHLTDDIHDRLWMLARQRKTTVSAVANDLLDKALPRWKVSREG